ncbi:MAG TPA: type II toxin-antitoxin system VapC family toxin [Anaerolineae bacterium]|nr:type II toxin-antitoxin system VapC family toxin [Anaerolineae bacterium]
MKYLLDTNACIGYLTGRAVNVLKRLQTTPIRDVAVCSIVKSELFYGAYRTNNPNHTLQTQKQFLNQFQSLPFDDEAAKIAGQIRADLATKGTPIGPNDLLIAAIAMANNVILVTHNTREFGRVVGLQYEDWA